MPLPFTVLVADFLEETSVEAPILQDIARLVLARAADESGLEPYAADADAILLFHEIPKVGEATFRRAPKCRCIVRAGVGYNNIDRAAAARHGVIACNVPDYGTEEVADHAIMLLLAVARRLVPSHNAIRAGGWDHRIAYGTPRMRGKTLGIIGCGRIGSATALRAKALGLDVVFYDPYVPQGTDKALGIRRAQQFDELLEQSHFVSLHCYLSEETHHMINARALARMRPGSILINTARGGIVDARALLDALDSGQVFGAGIDVVEVEPLDDERLRNHPSAILTPHTAFYSVEGYQELRTKAAEEIRRILLGEAPLNPVPA